MIIKLIQPPAHNWLIIADQLNDPETWTRFIPCHTADSERYKFETVIRTTCDDSITLKPSKELMKRGRCVYEYDWQVNETDILMHAMQVAEQLGMELDVAGSAETIRDVA
jgi:hypothetical protein